MVTFLSSVTTWEVKNQCANDGGPGASSHVPGHWHFAKHLEATLRKI
jgi:hypothetical protein